MYYRCNTCSSKCNGMLALFLRYISSLRYLSSLHSEKKIYSAYMPLLKLHTGLFFELWRFYGTYWNLALNKR